MTNTPITTVVIRILFMFSIGVNHSGLMIASLPSNPKNVPYINPKNVEVTPSGIATLPRKPPLPNTVSKIPAASRHRPCPTSPNIIPKNSEYITARNAVGSISLYLGIPYILTNSSNGLKIAQFLSFVGAVALLTVSASSTATVIDLSSSAAFWSALALFSSVQKVR